MFNPTTLIVDAFVERLRTSYLRTYGKLEPDFPGMITFIGRMALENIANSDAAYHNLRHTVMVTQAGVEVLKGKHLREGGVTPVTWLNFVTSLLCHDIGYVRGLCRDDADGSYVINDAGERVTLPPGATDAALTAYHIERGQLFVRERFKDHEFIDVDMVCANIERTRFPPADTPEARMSDDYPGLARASDFIGQMADINRMQQLSALYIEFLETGAAEQLGLHSAADLRASYPRFFWEMASVYLEPAVGYLRLTQEGKLWLASLYAHVFAEEHHISTLGPEPNRAHGS